LGIAWQPVTPAGVGVTLTHQAATQPSLLSSVFHRSGGTCCSATTFVRFQDPSGIRIEVGVLKQLGQAYGSIHDMCRRGAPDDSPRGFHSHGFGQAANLAGQPPGEGGLLPAVAASGFVENLLNHPFFPGLGNHDGRAFSGCVKPDLVLSVPVGKPNEKRQMRRNVSEEIARLLHLFVGSLEYRKDVVP